MVTAIAATSRIPKAVKAYLYTELAGTVVLETAGHLSIGFNSDAYRVLYCLVMIPIRLAAWRIAWKQSGRISLVAIPLGIGMMFASSYETVLDDNQWIIVVDGAAIISAGMALSFSALFIIFKRVYTTLALLWILLGAYNFAMVMNPSPEWQMMEDTVLPMMVIGAFGWIALGARSEAREKVRA